MATKSSSKKKKTTKKVSSSSTKKSTAKKKVTAKKTASSPIKKTPVITKTSASKKDTQPKVESAKPAKKASFKPLKLKISFSKNLFARVLMLISIVLVLFSGYTWYTKIYSSKSNVFWAMLDNNLNTRSVMRTITNQSGGDSISQRTYFGFGKELLTHTNTDIVQSGDIVKAETAGYRDGNYARYADYKPSQSRSGGLDLSSVLGKWAIMPEKKDDAGNVFTRKDQYLYDGLIQSSLFPFGDLTFAQRSELVKFAKDNAVFDPKFEYAKKTKLNGRDVYVYQLVVNHKKQALLMKKYADMMKVPMDSGDYNSNGESSIEMTVDIRSRRLISLRALSSSYEIKYTNYGVEEEIVRPKESMTIDELNNSIQSSQKS